MANTFRLAICQANPTAGDLSQNTRLVIENIQKARECCADLAIFPELVLSGYPPEDLLMRQSFIKNCAQSLKSIAKETKGITAVVGAPMSIGGALRNAAAILANGRVAGAVVKSELPNYGVFDEKRYFVAGTNGPLLKIGDAVAGISICEDIWIDNGILDRQVKDGANLLINISGSPYREGALKERRRICQSAARRLKVPFAYCNLVGGQDELVFDGRSFVVGGNGEIMAELNPFAADLGIVDFHHPFKSKKIKRATVAVKSSITSKPEAIQPARYVISGLDEEVYEALTLGVRDYVTKNGFKEVAVALSGGVDSALTCSIAVDALGCSRVLGVSMPSPFSSQGSVDDALKLANNLGIRLISLPIGEAMDVYDRSLRGVFSVRGRDVAEENIQSRIRGNLMMAISNKFGSLVLTTGNKSETAVGYCTLYGDMAGGLAVIKDVYKAKVYSLCHWRNRKAEYGLIPKETLEKEPSAELRPDQKDTDSLPPYDILDPILEHYIEQDRSVAQIVKSGFDRAIVLRIVKMVDLNEYKRRQGPIGLKITQKAFGRDRRLPITCKYSEK